MGSTLITKVRICLKSSRPFHYLRHPAFLTPKSPLCKSSQLSSSARFLCTRDTKPSLSGKRTERRSSGQIKTSAVSRLNDFFWDDEVDQRGKRSTRWQTPSFPKSVFAAGTAKRTAAMLKRKASLVSEDEEEPERTRGAARMEVPDRPLPAAEWRKLKESLQNPQYFDTKMMIALSHSGAELDIARSLLNFVTLETGSLSYRLLLQYLALCVNGGHNTEVFDVYEIMKGTFPSLDTGACSLFIKSFSRTARWREAVSILHELNKVYTPSARNYGDVIAAAVLHGDTITAWALYDELMEKGLSPRQETWGVLFEGARKTMEEVEEGTEAMSQTEQQEKLLEILLNMRNEQMYPKQSLASSMKTWFESLPGQKWTGSWTSINPMGVCRCCGSELESVQLTAEEYQQLKDRVMADVIQGQDVFNKTSPEELEKFKLFVKRKPAFDVVVDGLNVAYLGNDRSKRSELLLTVVSELESQGLIVLVLGRKHILQPSKSWRRQDMNLIQQKAHLFCTENISEDDPFLLFATLHSGNHCRFVSNDLMRDHKASLLDRATRGLFFKWQRGHQLAVDGIITAGRRVRFQSIPSYDTIVQTSGNSWHIPYDSTEDRSTYEVPQKWLCLHKKH